MISFFSGLARPVRWVRDSAASKLAALRWRTLTSGSAEFRFLLPDVLEGLSRADLAARSDVLDDRFVMVDQSDFYVRSTLVLNQAEGSVAYSVWLKVDEKTAELLGESWDGDSYRSLAFQAVLANAVPDLEHSTIGSVVQARVLNELELPYVVRAEATYLNDLILVETSLPKKSEAVLTGQTMLDGVQAIRHSRAVWSDRADSELILEMGGPVDAMESEVLAARHLSGEEFEICCVPFFSAHLSLGDIVLASSAGGVVLGIAKKSGHRVVRIWFEQSGAARAKSLEDLKSDGFLVEASHIQHFFVVDSRDSDSLDKLIETLGGAPSQFCAQIRSGLGLSMVFGSGRVA